MKRLDLTTRDEITEIKAKAAEHIAFIDEKINNLIDEKINNRKGALITPDCGNFALAFRNTSNTWCLLAHYKYLVIAVVTRSP